MRLPIVSIITPVYRAESTLDRCIRSVLAQTYTSWELVLVDDGSPDQSGKLCDDYARQHTNICVLHTDNRGVSAARNVGIAMAKGEYLLFLDSDDFLRDDLLERYMQAARNADADVVIGGLQVIEKDGAGYDKLPPTKGDFGTEIFETMCTSFDIFGYAGGKMVRASIIKKNQLTFREDMQSQEDADFFLSVYRYCHRFCQMPYAGYGYAYSAGKRVPPVWDFIANQLKLLRIAREATVLTEAAENAVTERIVLLVYSSLHDAQERGDFSQTVQKLCGVEGLSDALGSISGKGEKCRIAKWFIKGRYSRIRRFFTLRHSIRRIVRAVRRA